MRILDDLFNQENSNSITRQYSHYYESLSLDQSRIVVSDVLKKMVNEDESLKCTFNEDTFTLTVNGYLN